MVECEKQFFDAAYKYSTDKNAPIDLRGKCVDTAPDKQLFLTSAQIQTRQKLLTAITLYADQLQALASSGDDKNLDTNLQAAATNLNKEAVDHGLSKKDSSIAQDVESAVIGLTNVVLDQAKADDVKAAAKKQQDNLAPVVETLKAENTSLASSADGDIGTIRANLAVTLSAIRDQQGPVVFFDVRRARSYLRTLSPFASNGPTLRIRPFLIHCLIRSPLSSS